MTDFDVPVVHDWTVRLGAWRFGILEEDWGKLIPPTRIFLGRTQFETNYSAFACLAVFLIGIVGLITILSIVIARVGNKRKSEPCSVNECG